MKKKELICISCPIGCHLQVDYNEKLLDLNPTEAIRVTGNRCPKGEIYGREEVLSPKRMVTATARIHSKLQSRISVKTTAPILKELIPSLLREIYKLKLAPPVEMGKTLIKNYKNTGIDIVSTMELLE